MLATVRKALRLIGRDRRRRLLAIAGLSAVVSGLEAFSALLVLFMMRFVLEPKQLPTIPFLGGPDVWFPGASYAQLVLVTAILFGAFFIVRGIAFVFQQHAVSRVSENTGVALGRELVDGYLLMPYEFHLRRNSAESVRNAYDNVQILVTGVFTPIATLVSEGLLTGVMLIVLLFVFPVGTLLAAGVMGVVMIVILLLVQPRLQQSGRERQDAVKAALKWLQEGLGGLRDIKVLGREAIFSDGFSAARAAMARSQYRNQTLASIPRVAIETSFLMLLLAGIVWATHSGRVSGFLPSMAVFAYAGFRLQPSLQKIALGLNSLRFSEAALDDLQSDLDRVRSYSRLSSSRTTLSPRPTTFDQVIAFENVSFQYQGAAIGALYDISFEIQKGESIGVAGQTGGGKSTLVDLMCGLLTPTSGRITVDGVDIQGEVKAWQRNIGMVHQSSFLVDDTLRRNIALGVTDEEIDEDALWHAVEVAQLRSVVEASGEGLDTVVGERGVRLSGGQRQRITLARAIYQKPTLLILDEGTSALDNTTETNVTKALLRSSSRMTCVTVAHRLTTITACDRIVYLDAGRISGIGSYEDLRREIPQFAEMAR